MKRLIILLVLLASLASVTAAMARDQSRDYLMHIWKQQQADQRRWEAVQMARTPSEREQAYQNYIYNQPWLWEPFGD